MRLEDMTEILDEKFGKGEGLSLCALMQQFDPAEPHANELFARYWTGCHDLDEFLDRVEGVLQLRWTKAWGRLARQLGWAIPVRIMAIIDDYEIADGDQGCFSLVGRGAASVFTPCDAYGDRIRKVMVLKRGGVNVDACRKLGEIHGEFAVLKNTSAYEKRASFAPYRPECCYDGHYRVYEHVGILYLEKTDEAYV